MTAGDLEGRARYGKLPLGGEAETGWRSCQAGPERCQVQAAEER